jgi:hypothetical protein
VCAYDDIPSAFVHEHGRAAIFGLYVMHYSNKFKKNEGGIGGNMGDVPTINLV